jgi:type VI protein secretion system component VasF
MNRLRRHARTAAGVTLCLTAVTWLAAYVGLSILLDDKRGQA